MSSLRPSERLARILVVDATGQLASDLDEALQDLRRRMVTARTCAEAWMLVHQATFDTVVVEEAAEGGWQDLLAEISAMGAGLPVIIASRTADDRLWVDALAAGAYDVLSTPLEAAETRRVIQLATTKRCCNSDQRRRFSRARWPALRQATAAS